MIALTIFVAVAIVTVQAYPSRVVGGHNARDGQFPHQISLQYENLEVGIPRQHVCGASLITGDWIMTAGHCVTEIPQSGNPVYHAVAGINRLNDNGGDRQERLVIKTVVHPKYEGGVNPNDIAMMKLETVLIFVPNKIEPIILPQINEIPSGKSIISGWGSTGVNMPNDLQTVDMPIVPFKECASALKNILGSSEPLRDTNVCTGPLTGGVSACSGDSGGPLIIRNDANVTIQIGIVSWGIMPCGTRGAPSVYTRVSAFVDFIYGTMNTY